MKHFLTTNLARVVLHCALLVSSGCALAQTPAPLVYGGDSSFAPFEYLDNGGIPRGFQIDLLNEIARREGMAFQIRLADWSVTEADFRAGKLDLIALATTNSRRTWALLARPHATPATGIYMRQNQAAPVSLEELAGKRLAMDINSEAMTHTRESFLAGGQYQFVLVAGAQAALDAVVSGQADFALMARAIGDPLLARGVVKGLQAASFSPRLQAYGFAVAPGNTALRDRVESWLMKLESDGTLDALRQKWLASDREAAQRVQLEREVRWQGWELVLLFGVASIGGGLLIAALRRRTRRLAAERSLRLAREQELRLARARLDQAFAIHRDGMVVVTGSGLLLDANEAFCGWLGQRRVDLLGQSLKTLLPFEDDAVATSLFTALRQEGAFDAIPVTVKPVKATEASPEHKRALVVSGRRIALKDEVQAVVLMRDVTEQLIADEKLRAEFNALATEKLAQARELRHALEQARQSDEALQDFTAAIAHDLRAPLRVVRGFAGLLRDDIRVDDLDAALQNARRIEDAAAHMDQMLASLLRLAHVGRAGIVRTAIDMQSAAQSAWDLVSRAEAAGVAPANTAIAHLPGFTLDPLPAAQGDAGLVAQVWQNLLGNAYKYTSHTEGAKVRVDSFQENGLIWYRVVDNGAGFDMAHAEHLFRPFRRMHGADQFPGSGVGLSIVRRILLAHGGDIRARSAPGTGTVMEFTLGR